MTQINISMKQKQTQSHRGCQRGMMGGMDWEFGIGICTLFYTEWMVNRVLPHRELYSIFCDNFYGKRI